MQRTVESNIPSVVKSFEYVKNCHYLKLKDGKGREIMLVEHGLLRYSCDDCTYVFWTESNQAQCCPACGFRKLSQQWMRPQVALVPEVESDFPTFKPKKKSKKK